MGILEQFLHVRQAVETSAVEGCAEDRGSSEHDKVEKGFRAGDSILGLQSLCAMVLYPVRNLEFSSVQFLRGPPTLTPPPSRGRLRSSRSTQVLSTRSLGLLNFASEVVLSQKP